MAISDDADDGNIFDKKDRLLRIWENERNTRNLAVKLMWENMKYFGALIGALLAVYSTLLGHVLSTTNTSTIFNLLFLIPIPLTVIGLAWYARKDLIQRRKRFLLVVTHLLKLEDLLGLYQEIGGRLQHFQGDKYLFPHYHKDLVKCGTTDAYIELEMCKDNAFSSMQHIYIMMMAIAGILLILGLIFLVQPSLMYSEEITSTISITL